MTILYRSFLMVTFTLYFLVSSAAQIATDTILCGTDTVRISLDNYQFGKIGWEESSDGIHWVHVDNEFDTLFSYYTTEEKYIRACITSADCDPVYSHRAFIMQVPQAYAGEDKDLMLKYALLKGNNIPGASEGWEILSGSGGILADQGSSSTEFEFGSDDWYQITYTLANQCGSSTDTINLNFVENTYNENFISLDSADIIDYSRSDTLSGVYCISFDDIYSVNVEDAELLVSCWGDGFLLKIISFQQLNENTFVFRTSQGNLSDILYEGVLNMGDDIPNDSEYAKSTGHDYMLDHMPTRKELHEDPKYKKGVYIYRSPDRYSYMPGVKAAMASKGGFEFSPTDTILIGDLDESYLNIELGGIFRFDPNFVCDVKVGFFKLKYLKVGMENAELETGVKVNLDGYVYKELDSIAGKSLTKTLLTKTKYYTIFAGGIPIVVSNAFTVDFIVKPKVEASFYASYEWNRTSSFSAYLIKENNTGIRSVYLQNWEKDSTEYSMGIAGTAGVDLILKPEVNLKLYGVLGPYLAVPITLSPQVCGTMETPGEDVYNTWSFNIPLSVDARIGCALKIKKWTLFDRYVSFNLFQSGFYYPNSITITSGSHQQALPGARLLRPLEVKLKTTWGFPAPKIPVYFTVEEGDAILDSFYDFSDGNGFASTNLTLGTSTYNLIRVDANNCGLDHLAGGENLYFEVNSACKNSSLALSLDFQEDETVRLHGVMGRAPYTYYLDREGNTEISPEMNVFEAIGQPLYVVDADNCMASNMVSAMDTCRYSKLSVSVYLESTNASAFGVYGTPPYEYSLDDDLGFSSNNDFQYVSPGIHELFIRDNSGCISSLEFPVEMGIKDSLVAFYPFNGDARDESGRSNHGLVDGARLVPDRFGNPNSAYLFEAIDMITVTSHEDLVMEDDFAISFWAFSNFDPSLETQYPISIGTPDGNNGLHLAFESSDSCPLNLFVEKGIAELCFTDQISQYQKQEWHHFVLMRKMDTLTMYCDGIARGKMEVKGELFEACDLHIGNSSGKENGLRGSVDDIRIYNRILYLSEIYELFNENGWDDGILSNVYTDQRDQNVYNQVLIGKQVWMAENLRWLPDICPGNSDCGFHVYNYQGLEDTEAIETLEFNTYGVLYDYEQAADACPDGWHMPEQREWLELIYFIGDAEGYADYGVHPMYYHLGHHLKTLHGWPEEQGGSDKYSFSALPGGKLSISEFEHLGSSAFWWMQLNPEWEGQYSYVRLNQYDDVIMEANLYEDNSKSLRCIRDEGEIVLPLVFTDTARAIATDWVTSGGFVQDDGGDTVTALGICWSTLPKPDISLATKTSEVFGVGYFVSKMIGLDPETTYYVRAYATNSSGTSYGQELSITTAPQLIDVDQNAYNTVYIGEQHWMAENLRTSRYKDGTLIQEVDSEFVFGWSQSEGEYAWYENDSVSNESVYGKLYNWYAVNTENVCPAGWHVPEDSEWSSLVEFLGGENIAGGRLKEAGSSHWEPPNLWSTNSSGFTALPGGAADLEMGYWNMKNLGYWWTATNDPVDSLAKAFCRTLSSSSRTIVRSSVFKEELGLSIRCIKD